MKKKRPYFFVLSRDDELSFLDNVFTNWIKGRDDSVGHKNILKYIICKQVI